MCPVFGDMMEGVGGEFTPKEFPGSGRTPRLRHPGEVRGPALGGGHGFISRFVTIAFGQFRKRLAPYMMTCKSHCVPL